MTTTRISPTQVQANGYICEFEDDEEAEDFQACASGVDVAYCELKHAVIRKLPVEGVCNSVRSKNRTDKLKVAITNLSVPNFAGQSKQSWTNVLTSRMGM